MSPVCRAILTSYVRFTKLGKVRLFCSQVVSDGEPLTLARVRLSHFQRELEEQIDVERHKAERQLVHNQPFLIRIKDDVRHYYNGFKGFMMELIEVNKLLTKFLREKKPLDREARLKVQRIKTDCVKLIPASIIMILPFTALILPFFFKFFPHFLPSSFIEPWRELDLSMKLSQVRIEMANQLEKLFIAGNSRHLSPQKMAEFIHLISQMRSKTDRLEVLTLDDVQKYREFGKANPQLLNNFTEDQLVCLGKSFEIGLALKLPQMIRPSLLKKFQLLYKDDTLIAAEGLVKLNFDQLRSACMARGLPGFQLTEEELRTLLAHWMELSRDVSFPRSFLAVGTTAFWPRRQLGDVERLRLILASAGQSCPAVLDIVNQLSDDSSLEDKLSKVKQLQTELKSL